jgi:hypothetical protein
MSFTIIYRGGEMKLNKKEVAQNLRLFGYKKFGTMKKFAEALDMNPSTLYSGYLNGRSIPGPVLLVKLIDLGCNINWLLTGRETMVMDQDKERSLLSSAAIQPSTLSPAYLTPSKVNGAYADSRR